MSSPRTKIAKFDDAKRIVWGEVYIPNQIDSHGDFMVAAEIEKMAHDFLRNGFVNEIDTEHNLVNCGAQVVESFIVRKGDPDFTEGAWVLGVHIPDDDNWGKVIKGEFGGFSMYGEAYWDDRVIEIEIPDDGIVRGETYEHDGHKHTFVVKFDEEGNFLGGETDEVAGHSHKITRGTVTDSDEATDHNHRFSFLENL